MTLGLRADVHDRLEPFAIEPDGAAVTARSAGYWEASREWPGRVP